MLFPAFLLPLFLISTFKDLKVLARELAALYPTVDKGVCIFI